MRKISDRLIILRTLKHSEADLIIHGLSPSRGRVNLIAKGALKSKKRFVGGVLEPSHYVEVLYSDRSHRGEGALSFLEDAKLLRGFELLRSDYTKLELGFYFLKVIGRILQEEDPDAQAVFDLTGNALASLEFSQDLERLRVHFESKVLFVQGVMPEGLPENDLVARPLKDHEKAKLSDEDFLRVKGTVQFSLKQYLENRNH